ncbi:transposase [Streptomyces longwoodensis]|uniref:transposase n=1 Tax=Streptomyces longwoodensis TaxID=68231 RepID=UPI003F54A37F
MPSAAARTSPRTSPERSSCKPLSPPAGRARGRGRDHRQVLEGVVFKFRTGVPWRDLPPPEPGTRRGPGPVSLPRRRQVPALPPPGQWSRSAGRHQHMTAVSPEPQPEYRRTRTT